jgi:hypothetical protein
LRPFHARAGPRGDSRDRARVIALDALVAFGILILNCAAPFACPAGAAIGDVALGMPGVYPPPPRPASQPVRALAKLVRSRRYRIELRRDRHVEGVDETRQGNRAQQRACR